MALPLGKLTILVGAGIVGSVLAKEGHLPSFFPDFVSGAFKFALKQVKRDDSVSSNGKPINKSLMDQVNSLRQELQMIASNRSVTIVTDGGTGATKYGTIVLVVVVGSGYVWWKGWKLPDMMFATRRSLSDACTSIAQQLETVYGSIRSTRKELSSNIAHLDATLDEVTALTTDTRETVSELLKDSTKYDHGVRNVRETVQTLGQKISKMEEKQGNTMHGLKKLVDYTYIMENYLLQENAQASRFLSWNATLSAASSSSRIAFPPKNALPPPSSEPTSPTVSNGTLQRSNGSSGSGEVLNSPGISYSILQEETNGGTSSWSRPTILMRTRSATNAVLHRTNSSRQ
ncbi:uncharacterized protein LOC126655247 isoform X1 [Mercurialis annua]|uniref:uncharacterized protein LOC126655247 isoform X1 n=1 Tax=Mercurialis annua TaxID=3986 RepID=UPI00215E6963|nr:uncharacterized protein LOC126655247 isoform X1 [Mercurialis annua]